MDAAPDPESTHVLLVRAQQGDERALRLLYERYLARVRQWARGTLSGRARDVLDTDVLSIQVLTSVFLKIPHLRSAHELCFRSYVRTALRNAVISANRTAKPESIEIESVTESLVDDQPTPLERLIYRNTEQAVVRAFNQLEPRLQKTIILRRVEGRSHRQVAEALDYPSEAAARVACARAYEHLLERIRAITDLSTAA